MPVKRIGILTGGGDVPGLNSVIKTVVYRGSEIDCEVIGIRRGWEGLTHVNLEDPLSIDQMDSQKFPFVASRPVGPPVRGVRLTLLCYNLRRVSSSRTEPAAC